MLQFTLTGRLTTDPKFSTYGPDNTPMARLRVASNQPGVDKTDYFDVAVFGEAGLDAIAAARTGDKVQLKGTGRDHFWVTDAGEQRREISLAARSVEHTPRHSTSAAVAQHTQTASAAR